VTVFCHVCLRFFIYGLDSDSFFWADTLDWTLSWTCFILIFETVEFVACFIRLKIVFLVLWSAWDVLLFFRKCNQAVSFIWYFKWFVWAVSRWNWLLLKAIIAVFNLVGVGLYSCFNFFIRWIFKVPDLDWLRLHRITFGLLIRWRLNYFPLRWWLLNWFLAEPHIRHITLVQWMLTDLIFVRRHFRSPLTGAHCNFFDFGYRSADFFSDGFFVWVVSDELRCVAF
jgi:hypothetical protein